ncbi:prepilin-type N-terminal cleavage/methylation domain-containing protein [Candidatus Dojkabacteria bacterium]|nr:prepilin-type N-terminal cleavage/methylation domain-containing protein [Candidatus Dojkabacteria bacterium]
MKEICKYITQIQLKAKCSERKAILQAFTLLELLLVIAIISVLAGIIMFALKPADRLREANQTKYLSNANDLEKAMNSYIVDNGGNLPTAFNSLSYGYYDICRQGQSGNCVSLDELVTSGKMSSIPVDSDNQTATTTGFKLRYDPSRKEAMVYSHAEYTSRISSGTTLTEGLIGYWKMDEASWNGTAGEVKDVSGNNSNGTATGGVVIGSGRYGNNGVFDGINDYIELGDINTYDFSNREFAISAWINIPSYPVNAGACGPVSPIFVNNDYGYALRVNGLGFISFSKYTNTSSSTGVSSISSITPNVYHHILAVYRLDKIELYIDGVFSNSNNIASSEIYYSVGDSPEIGRLNNCGGGNYFFTGKIDDVRIYNRKINTEEAYALYEWGPVPIGRWELDEGSGLTASDLSGNGFSGTLVNNPTWVSGKYGNAILFSGGTDYLRVNSPFYDYSKQITVSWWVNPSGEVWAGQSSADIDNMNTNVWLMHASGANVYWYVNDTGIWRNVGTGNLPVGQWSYITGIANEIETAVYVNGVKINSTTGIVNGIRNNPSSQIHLGKDSRYVAGTLGRMMIGKVDSLKVYNYARTPEQIVKDMNNL